MLGLGHNPDGMAARCHFEPEGAKALIRAIAVDIDGTITDSKRVLCPASLQAMQDLSIPVILTTGNTHCFTRTMAITIGAPLVFIAENGGVVSYSDQEMEILADLQECEAAYRELSKVFQLQRHDSRYRFTDISLQRNFDVEAATRYALEHYLQVEIIDTTFAVHIKDRNVNKGTGLCRIAGRLGIDIHEFAAIGDSKSDISMFKLAGFRAAVSNADPELKAFSDYVAEKKYGLGFAEIVAYMLDKKMF
jgi:phosphoglycolate phosphatase (TIGR01487 family)